MGNTNLEIIPAIENVLYFWLQTEGLG